MRTFTVGVEITVQKHYSVRARTRADAIEKAHDKLSTDLAPTDFFNIMETYGSDAIYID